MKARFARWHASLAVGLFGRRHGAALAAAPPATPHGDRPAGDAPSGDLPARPDPTQPDVRPGMDALVLLARLIHERTTLSPWRDADFWERERSFLAARAVLEEMGAHQWLDPALGHLSFRSDGTNGANCIRLSEHRLGRRR